jgi:succinoglycan biosynthesis protein ExoH
MLGKKTTENRIDLLRSLMIFGVVILHTPPYIPIAAIGSAPFDLIVAFFQHAVFRTTVPVLTCISGYLLFRASLDLQPLRLLQKKCSSIVIPFLVFNLSLVAAFLLIRAYTGVSVGSTTIETTGEWLDATLGLTAEPLNYPLNFLRDLIPIFMLAPLMGWFLRKSIWAGLILILLVFAFNLDGSFILRNAMLPVFYVGGMAAVQKWDVGILDCYAAALLALFLGICACIVYFHIANTTYLQLTAPLLIWPAASLLATTALGAWLARMSKYSYFLFLAHAPVLLLVSMIHKKYLSSIPFPIYWIATPLIVTCIVIAVYKLAMQLSPNTFNAMIGNSQRRARASTTNVPERRKAARPADAPIYTPEFRMTLRQINSAM